MERTLVQICGADPVRQFAQFMQALGDAESVPVIAPKPLDLSGIQIHPEADFAVATSGTTGKPSVYFRTRQSWQGFVPVQNAAFGLSAGARLFTHGSLSFTGNLNLVFAAHASDMRWFTVNSFRADVWANCIIENDVDSVYLIPDKLVHLCTAGLTFPRVRTVLCGSQLVTPPQYARIRAAFPEARIILYYGASETNYISYTDVSELHNTRCVGRVFDTVHVDVSADGHILVSSPWLVCGISAPYDTGDLGFFEGGQLYFDGRADDVLNVGGEKINKAELVRRLCAVPGVDEAEITVGRKGLRGCIVAHIAGAHLPGHIPAGIFDGIPPVLRPKEYTRYVRLPRNASGKVCVREE